LGFPRRFAIQLFLYLPMILIQVLSPWIQNQWAAVWFQSYRKNH